MYAPVVDYEAKQTLQFVRNLPHFNLFGMNDKIILFKKNCFLMFLLRHVLNFSKDGLPLPILIPYDTLAAVYGRLITEIISLAENIKGMELKIQEIAVFTALVFFQPDGSTEIKDKETLETACEYYKLLLDQEMSERPKKLEKLLDLVPTLQKMSKFWTNSGKCPKGCYGVVLLRKCLMGHKGQK